MHKTNCIKIKSFIVCVFTIVIMSFVYIFTSFYANTNTTSENDVSSNNEINMVFDIPDDISNNSEVTNQNYVPNEIIIQTEYDVDETFVVNSCNNYGLNVEFCKKIGCVQDLNSSIFNVKYNSEIDANQAVSLITQSNIGFNASINVLHNLCDYNLNYTSVNDSYVSQQWGLNIVEAFSAWDYTKTNHQNTIAILDSGVKYDHYDLSNNLSSTINYAKNIHTSHTGQAAVDDTNGHGTHCAGIASACTNNGIGIAGVSYNADILPIKVTNNEDKVPADYVIEALSYIVSLKKNSNSPAALKNIKVLNMSFGAEELSTGEQDAINAVNNSGIVVCAATGNGDGQGNPKNVDYPAKCNNVIGVGSCNQQGTYSSWSNYGEGLDLLAPGENIISSYNTGKNNYAKMSGTSMATPLVSGIASLVAGFNPNLSPSEIESILENFANDKDTVGRDDRYGYGIINAKNSVQNTKFLVTIDLAGGQINNIPSGWTETNGVYTKSYNYGTKIASIINEWKNIIPTKANNEFIGWDKSSGAISQNTVIKANWINQEYLSKPITIGAKKDVNKVLDVAGGSQANSANVSIYSKNNTPAQIWYMEKTNDGYIVFRNKKSWKVLDVSGGRAYNGSNVQQYDYNGTPAQKWKLIQDSNNYKFLSAIDNKFVLDISGGSLNNFSNIQLYSDNGTPAQRFSINIFNEKPCEIINPGTYYLRSAIGSNSVIDISGGSYSYGANAQLFKKNGTGAQKWIIDMDSNGIATIKRANTNLSLDVCSGIASSGTNIWQYGFNNTRAQKWKFVKVKDGYNIVSAMDDNLCIDVSGGNPNNCSNIQLYSCNYTNAQLWYLDRI